MALKKLVERITKPVADQDREDLAAFVDSLDVTPMHEIPLRAPVALAGEVRSVRIVPRAGAPALEVTVSDGRGSVVAVFLGRRRIAGITPGRRLLVEGVVGRHGPELQLYNPRYRLL